MQTLRGGSGAGGKGGGEGIGRDNMAEEGREVIDLCSSPTSTSASWPATSTRRGKLFDNVMSHQQNLGRTFARGSGGGGRSFASGGGGAGIPDLHRRSKSRSLNK